MGAQELIAKLRALGKPATALIYSRHGVLDETFGVTYADLKRMLKTLRVDQALARQLWESGIHDARVLATRVADASQVTRDELESWLGQVRDHITVDSISALAARTPQAWKLAQRWIRSRDEWVSAAGWNVISILAIEQRLEVESADRLIEQIRETIARARNRTRHSMNNALIAIGGSIAELTDAALVAAHAIGEVEVDHGETGCTTPDAVAYIQKMRARTRITGTRSKPARKSAKKPAKKPAKKARKPALDRRSARS
ncbi:MAG: DNA alkylation repair protein [Pseudomonadota bacterium]